MSAKYFCDACGAELSERRHVSVLVIECKTSKNLAEPDYDLCRPCLDRLLAAIDVTRWAPR